LSAADDIAVDSWTGSRDLGLHFTRMTQQAAQGMRASGFKAPHSPVGGEGRFMMPALETYQSTTAASGLDEVTRAFGPKVGGVFAEMRTMLEAVRQLPKTVGVDMKVPSQQELRAAGQGEFFPQYLKNVSLRRQIDGVSKYFQNMMGLSKEEAISRASELLESRSRLGVDGLFGFELNRLPGTTAQKIAAGMPLVDDPFAAAFRFMSAAQHRVAIAKTFGPKNEVTKTLLGVARRTGENVVAINNFIDNMIGVRWDHGFWARFVNSVNDFEPPRRLCSRAT
jgi:hypothetical protein